MRAPTLQVMRLVSGVFIVENPEHSDFLLLRNMLVRTHMQDLKDVTRENHYENYRAQCIQSMTRMVVQERRRRSVAQGSPRGQGPPRGQGSPRSSTSG